MNSEKPKVTVYPSLYGRIVVVTGGATGIGEAFVEAFAAQGARVCFLDVQDDAANALVERLSKQAFTPRYLHCDLTDIAALKSAFVTILAEFRAVHVLINNAGNDNRHRTDEITPEFWDKTMELNLRHQFFAMQAVLPAMRQQQRGSILNMSSIAWMIPSTNQSAYVAAKAAILGMTRSMAHEEGSHNIRINAILPGAILTERQKKLWLTPEYETKVLEGQSLKRMLLPAEVANLALFLAADDSSAITGQGYIVDGGWV